MKCFRSHPPTQPSIAAIKPTIPDIGVPHALHTSLSCSDRPSGGLTDTVKFASRIIAPVPGLVNISRVSQFVTAIGKDKLAFMGKVYGLAVALSKAFTCMSELEIPKGGTYNLLGSKT